MKGILLVVLLLATAPLYADYTPFYLGLLTEVLVFGLFALAFDVPAGCVGPKLSLIGLKSDTLESANLWVDALTIRPIS